MRLSTGGYLLFISILLNLYHNMIFCKFGFIWNLLFYNYTKRGIKQDNSYQKINNSLHERPIKKLTENDEMFQHSERSVSIRREWIYVEHMVNIASPWLSPLNFL